MLANAKCGHVQFNVTKSSPLYQQKKKNNAIEQQVNYLANS